jgi:hypothetical protein
MPETQYFELNDDIGLNAEGNPEPLHEIGVTVAIPTMNGDDVVSVPQRTTVKPIPGTRIFKTDDQVIAAAIFDSGLVHETNAPSQSQLKQERDVTKDARDQSGKLDDTPNVTAPVNPAKEN